MDQMKSFLRRKNIIARRSAIHGFGVFAEEDIKKGDIIEECKVLDYLTSVPEFQHHVFSYADISAIPLGYGCIYNHSNVTNAKHQFDYENKLMVVTALKAIKKGEEIFISYGDTWFSSRKISYKTYYPLARNTKLYSLMLKFSRFGVVIAMLFVFQYLFFYFFKK